MRPGAVPTGIFGQEGLRLPDRGIPSLVGALPWGTFYPVSDLSSFPRIPPVSVENFSSASWQPPLSPGVTPPRRKNSAPRQSGGIFPGLAVPAGVALARHPLAPATTRAVGVGAMGKIPATRPAFG